MNFKKKTLVALAIVIFFVMALVQTQTFAMTTDKTKYFGITYLRDRTTPRMGYGIGNPKSGGGAYIWNIKEYNSTSDSSGGKTLSAYCMKAGVGFGTGNNAKAEYNRSYNLLDESDKSQIQNDSSVSSLVSEGHYNQIVALLNMFYVPESSTAEADKNALLAAAGVPTTTDYASYLLTDDDIEATQQAALWYFTNSGTSIYNQLSKSRWMNYTLEGDSYSSLSDYNRGQEEGEERQGYIEQLYNYLVNTANGATSTTPQALTVNKESATITEEGTNYDLGPFEITPGNVPCGLTVTVSGVSNPTILKDSSKSTSSVEAMKEGGTFYIRVPKTAVTESVNVSFQITSTTTGMTLWTKPNASEQPIVVLDKTPKPTTVEKTFTPEKKGVFDLALRKYITEVKTDGATKSTGELNREPDIKTEKLAAGSETTADYNHQKEPVEVKEGSIVTYSITVYNEGDIAGRATQIIDQLPEGLVLVSYSGEEPYTIEGGGKVYLDNAYYNVTSYDTETNKIVINELRAVPQGSINENLDPYPGSGDPDSTTIKLKCKVTATGAQTKDTVLTNIAWIAEDSKAENSVTDRDSSPAEAPTRNKNNLVSSNKNDYKGNDSNPGVSTDTETHWKGQQDDDDFEKVVIPGKEVTDDKFDLRLKKRITEVNGEKVEERIESVDVSKLNISGENSETDADIKMNKDPVLVKTGDLVKYTFRIYNEGDIDGYASRITEDIPEGLALPDEESSDSEELKAVAFNEEMGWELDEAGTVSTRYLEKKGDSEDNLIPAFGKNDGSKTEEDLKYKEVSIIFKVTSKDATTEPIRNEAEISENRDKNNANIEDRDSEAGLWRKYEDDEDYDNVILEENPGEFDLRLIKRITKVNDKDVEERILDVDVSSLNTENSVSTDAIIDMEKDPVPVKTGDIVTYTFRIYNEGYIDGYASEITEDVPEGLEFIWDERTDEELQNATDLTDEEKAAIKFNQDMYWTRNEDGTISTDYLSKESSEDNLIPAFGKNDGSKTEDDLKYKEVSVMFKVTSLDTTGAVLRNEAAITESRDSNDEEVKDRDSTDVWVKYEDDEDYDNVVLESFDLALRKFIIAISRDENIEESEYLKENEKYTREPQVDTSNLNKLDENGNKVTTATYNHPKTPIDVTVGDTVVYMLRVYNEGDVNGYAAEIKDHLPQYLEFVDGEFNDQYGWEIGEDGRTITTTYLKDQLIEKAAENENGEIVLSYKEVPIMCKVKPEAQADYKITNLADITVYEDENHQPANDRDSEENNVQVPTDDNFPSYKDDEIGSYVPGQEDDDDFEKVVVRIFDLALRKWVTQAIVIEDGVEHVVDTGHQPFDDPEELVKVDLSRKKLNNTTVKFRYSIRVINQGGIAGAATEVTDYIPAGLKMDPADNPQWTDKGNNVAVTNQLADTILQPGEYADIEILLTWINNEEDLGVKTNTAEISADYNEFGLPDIDSIPGNQKPGEDDIDDAPVILSITTGKAITYIILTLTSLGLLSGGITLIKKYVIKK